MQNSLSMVKYNHKNWDLTDKEEVDLANKAVEVSRSPIMALDATYDAADKLLRVIEAHGSSGVHYFCTDEKLKAIIERFRELADRIEKLPHYTSEDSSDDSAKRLRRICELWEEGRTEHVERWASNIDDSYIRFILAWAGVEEEVYEAIVASQYKETE